MSSYSPLAKESLAERVCKMDKSLEQSGIQVPVSRLRIPNNDGGNPSSLCWGRFRVLIEVLFALRLAEGLPLNQETYNYNNFWGVILNDV